MAGHNGELLLEAEDEVVHQQHDQDVHGGSLQQQWQQGVTGQFLDENLRLQMLRSLGEIQVRISQVSRAMLWEHTPEDLEAWENMLDLLDQILWRNWDNYTANIDHFRAYAKDPFELVFC